MKVGFSGTRKGMSQYQKDQLRYILMHTQDPISEFHHGDCIGADADAHEIVRTTLPDAIIVIHPPSDSGKRAKCAGDRLVPEKPYLERNHNIVDATDIMIFAPAGNKEELRSGTWSTFRYAKKQCKGVCLLPRKENYSETS